jgi:SAM-dependent methyltransferase
VNRSTIAALHCPHCGSAFSVDQVLKESGEDIIDAVISCECRRYPVLNGILIMQTVGDVQRVIEKVEKGSVDDAFKLLVQSELAETKITAPTSPVRIDAFFKIWWVLWKKHREAVRKVDCLGRIDELSFCEMIGKLLSGNVRDYFVHRFSFQSLWNVYALIPLIKEAGAPVLDFGCGYGHGSFLLSQLLPARNIFCVEKSFLKLFLMKHYFADTERICLDKVSLLPFKDGFFSTVFSMDAFHIMSSKLLLAREFQRVLKGDGVLLLTHLPNLRGYNPFPLSPAAYQKLFDVLETRLIPEERLVEKLYEDALDLTGQYSEELINSSDSNTLIGSRESGVFKSYSNVKGAFLGLKSNLELNPIYRVEERNGRLLLARKELEKYGSESPIPDRILPKELEIDKEILRKAKMVEKGVTREEMEAIDGLMEKFVLVNVPPNYV